MISVVICGIFTLQNYSIFVECFICLPVWADIGKIFSSNHVENCVNVCRRTRQAGCRVLCTHHSRSVSHQMRPAGVSRWLRLPCVSAQTRTWRHKRSFADLRNGATSPSLRAQERRQQVLSVSSTELMVISIGSSRDKKHFH